jgi:hypothetical protein
MTKNRFNISFDLARKTKYADGIDILRISYTIDFSRLNAYKSSSQDILKHRDDIKNYEQKK